MGRIAAFFDFDQTLLSVESGRVGIAYMWREREISLGFLARVMLANLLFQNRLLSDRAMVRIVLSIYRGRRLDEFASRSGEFYREHLHPLLAPNIVRRAREHREQGHVLVLASGAVRYLLEPVAADLGFEHLLCTDLEEAPDGRLTGRSAGPVCIGEAKREAALGLAGRLDLDLSLSYAYGNHTSDLPLLELVGRPAAVAPTSPLERIARARGWPVLSHR